MNRYDIKKLFTSDILSYVKNRYLLKYKRHLNDSIFVNLEDFDAESKEQFSLMVESFDIQIKLATPFRIVVIY